MAKYYAGIDTSIGVGNETLDGMLTNGSTYGISPSQTIDCSSIIADTNIGIGTTNPDGMLHISSGTANSDCVLIIESDTDDNDEFSNPQIWFKQDGDKNVGFVGQNSNTLVISNNVSTAGGISFRTGTTNNTGTTDPLTGTTEKLSIESNGLVKGTLHTLIGEHSAATTAGQLFSFGNGATDNEGPAMPFAGEVVVVTISKSGGTNAGIFQPSKNGVTQGDASDQITTTTGSGTVTKNNTNYTSLMDFAAGDRINYVTIDDTDTTTCLTMVVRFNP